MRDFDLSTFDLGSFDPTPRRQRRATPGAPAPRPFQATPQKHDNEIAELRQTVAILTERLALAEMTTRGELARRGESTRHAEVEVVTPPLIFVGHHRR